MTCLPYYQQYSILIARQLATVKTHNNTNDTPNDGRREGMMMTIRCRNSPSFLRDNSFTATETESKHRHNGLLGYTHTRVQQIEAIDQVLSLYVQYK